MKAQNGFLLHLVKAPRYLDMSPITLTLIYWRWSSLPEISLDPWLRQTINVHVRVS